MMGGVYYIWIMLGFFLAIAGLLALITGVLWIGHWIHKKETGAKEGFLELPMNLRTPKPDDPANKTP